MTVRASRLLQGVLLALALPAAVCAQDAAQFPNKPVRVIVPQGPGGATDIQARLFAAKMTQSLGQQFVVDNRAGGGAAGVVAYTLATKANADGYTLLAIIPSFTFSPALYKNYPIDPIRDFAPVSLLTRAPYMLVVNPSLPARSAKDLIAMAKAQPDKLTFGAGNTGSGTHLVTLSFLSAAKIRATYVPYRSVGMAMLDLAGGRIDATLANVLSASTYVRTGKLRVLGISSVERSKALPDVPTIAEQGVPGYEAVTFHGYAVPAATPAAIVNKLSAAYASVVKSPDIAGRLAADGGEAIGSTPQAFRKFIAAEIRVWTKLIKEEGVKIE
ncbi:MAG: tripartite tricarboxylate transporter substrate binding protein [Betaproteobacteria bacterium]|nr:tripartite tricarboxylate transporter substrate binding protein [Betaproteobacteria bacterium]